VRDPVALRTLHVPGRPLVLPNAWDASSARAVAAAGFPVVATTSAGVAEALGFEDGEAAPVEEMLAAARRIASAVDIPVTVDFERGYRLGPEEIAAALVEAGASGCNLEDTDRATGALVPVADQAAWLARICSADLVVNARIDIFLRDRTTPQLGLVPDALERARAYAEAGAACVYPIGLADDDALRAFLADAPAPANVLARPGDDLGRLAELGVARISFGSGFFRLALDAVETALRGAR